jgi:hydrogenase maturation protein HypF
MAPFEMCQHCASEYHDPADRRFHAQPVCCPACGPQLRLLDASGAALPGEPLAGAAALLRSGAVLAVKGLGGFHVATLAADAAATALLRARKHREDKPFAVMVADLTTAHQLCVVDPVGERVLTGRRRPVVLLPRRPEAPVAPAVAPGNRNLGLMLPYTPLHHLLLRDVAEPIVLTSGNISDEPIAYQDDDARHRLTKIADAYLTHDRAIHMRTDDSVVRVFRGAELPVRRSRGYAPEPLTLAHPVPRPILGCGAELKSTFCLARGRHAFLSHHIGDLENYETLRSFTEGVQHFRRLFDGSTCPPSTPLTCLMWSCWEYNTTTRTSPPAWPTMARPVRCWEWPSTGRATAATAPCGGVSSCLLTSPDSSGWHTWYRSRCPVALRPSGNPGGWPQPTWVLTPHQS